MTYSKCLKRLSTENSVFSNSGLQKWGEIQAFPPTGKQLALQEILKEFYAEIKGYYTITGIHLKKSTNKVNYT